MRYVWHVSSASRRIIEARIDLRGRTRPIIASTGYRMSLIEKKTWTIRSCSFSSDVENDVKNVKYIITESEDHLHEHENNFSFFLFSKRNIINIFGNQSNIIKISTLFTHTHTHTYIYIFEILLTLFTFFVFTFQSLSHICIPEKETTNKFLFDESRKCTHQ